MIAHKSPAVYHPNNKKKATAAGKDLRFGADVFIALEKEFIVPFLSSIAESEKGPKACHVCMGSVEWWAPKGNCVKRTICSVCAIHK